MSDSAAPRCEYVRGPTWTTSRSICRKPGKVTRDGRHFCGVHDPVAREARQKARDQARRERWDAESKARNLSRAIDQHEREMERIATSIADALSRKFELTPAIKVAVAKYSTMQANYPKAAK